jgi:hypothetical protein
VQHVLQRADLVAQRRRLFEMQQVRLRLHGLGEPIDDLAVPALEEQFGQAHVGGIVGSEIRPTQGALQRRIWCSRQGRERFWYTGFSQVRSRKVRCSRWMLSRTAWALGKGPK